MIGMGQLAIACGGTGGHLFPGLAVAEAVRRRGHEVSFFISTKAVDRRALSGAGIGAGAGAVGGLLVGDPVTGALLGGAIGAGAGALTDKDQIDLGKPAWK